MNDSIPLPTGTVIAPVPPQIPPPSGVGMGGSLYMMGQDSFVTRSTSPAPIPAVTCYGSPAAASNTILFAISTECSARR